ncbi:YdhR family protein [Ottowia sp.]|uniref:YdhR family protein n=1 Tax=Ottowia sp. TaxID=1898956 RepID=UPI003A86E07E
MITTITTFALPKAITREEAKGIFLSTAPRYQAVPGLVRKCYVLSEDGKTAGGIYLWKRREDALALYTEEWRAFVREKYQTEPQVTYFSSPVVVDNLTHEILADD